MIRIEKECDGPPPFVGWLLGSDFLLVLLTCSERQAVSGDVINWQRFLGKL